MMKVMFKSYKPRRNVGIWRVFGVLPMVPLVGTIGTNDITIFTICTNFSTNGTIGN